MRSFHRSASLMQSAETEAIPRSVLGRWHQRAGTASVVGLYFLCGACMLIMVDKSLVALKVSSLRIQRAP